MDIGYKLHAALGATADVSIGTDLYAFCNSLYCRVAEI